MISPGPWKTKKNEGGVTSVLDADGRVVCVVPEAEDAAFIAKAPELRKLVEKAASDTEVCALDDERFREDLDRLLGGRATW